jgi:HlyD family secretion protein
MPPPRKESKRTLYIIGGLLVVAVAAAVVLAIHKKTSAGLAITTEKAAIRTITQVVTATGKIQPEIMVKISSEVYGEIVELPFRDGDRVKKGQLIVKIKPDLYQASVDQQTAAVASARGAAVDSEAKVEKARADLKQYEDLHQRKLVSDSDYVTYKTNSEIAKADYVSALANVQAAEGLLNQARDTLSKTVIYSPMDGIVSARLSEVGERVVAQSSFTGTEIMDVADLSNMEVQVNVNENDIPNVKAGDPVVISIDAYPDRKFAGFVKEISSSAESTDSTGSGSSNQANNTASDEVTNFLVKIRVTDRDINLRPGMSATADIQTQTDPNVVAVPIQSVTVRDAAGLTSDEVEQKKAKEAEEKSGNDMKKDLGPEDARRAQLLFRRVVFIKAGDKVKLQPVETGIADDTYIEVKRGVKPGDEVVSGTYAAISRTLKDGSLVYTEPAKAKPAN